MSVLPSDTAPAIMPPPVVSVVALIPPPVPSVTPPPLSSSRVSMPVVLTSPAMFRASVSSSSISSLAVNAPSAPIVLSVLPSDTAPPIMPPPVVSVVALMPPPVPSVTPPLLSSSRVSMPVVLTSPAISSASVSSSRISALAVNAPSAPIVLSVLPSDTAPPIMLPPVVNIPAPIAPLVPSVTPPPLFSSVSMPVVATRTGASISTPPAPLSSSEMLSAVSPAPITSDPEASISSDPPMEIEALTETSPPETRLNAEARLMFNALVLATEMSWLASSTMVPDRLSSEAGSTKDVPFAPKPPIVVIPIVVAADAPVPTTRVAGSSRISPAWPSIAVSSTVPLRLMTPSLEISAIPALPPCGPPCVEMVPAKSVSCALSSVTLPPLPWPVASAFTSAVFATSTAAARGAVVSTAPIVAR